MATFLRGELLDVYLVDGKTTKHFNYDGQFEKLSNLTRGPLSEPIFLLFQLIEARDFLSLFLLFIGLIKKLLRVKPALSQKDSQTIFTTLQDRIIAFKPKMVVVQLRDRKIRFHCDAITLIPQLIMIKELILDNQYGATKKNVGGKVVVDAGSNVGIFSIYAAVLGAKKIYAYEPVAETYAQLRQNISLNGLEDVIIPINSALGETRGFMQIGFRYAGDWGASSNFDARFTSFQQARILTLDEYMKDRDKVAFIKVDVEGMEAEVLRGSLNTLLRSEIVSAEIHSPDRLREVRQIMADCGFKEVMAHELIAGVYLVQWANKSLC
jgi:FkbM family methyltransferase